MKKNLSSFRLNTLFISAFCVLSVLSMTGCGALFGESERLPAEDLEVLQFYQREIAVLKNPNIPTNSKEKYEAAKALVKKVDFTCTRETKTLDEIFYFGDAIVSSDEESERTITFIFQYGNRYVRLMFYCYDRFVFKVEEIVK